MTTFDQLITGAALLGLAVSTIISYLKVNKLWARRHIKEVTESISVAAALLSLLTTVPFMIKFLVIEVKREEKIGLWKMLRRALATERGELAYLIHSFARPREAPAILEILRLVSMVDNDFDERERELLESVALPWGIHPDDMKTTGPEAKSDISSVQRAFADYLGLKPPASQVEKVFDLVRFMVHADRKVTRDERLILTEVEGAVGAYLTDGSKSPDVFEVLLVPQNDQQFEKMREEVTDPSLQERAGGRRWWRAAISPNHSPGPSASGFGRSISSAPWSG